MQSYAVLKAVSERTFRRGDKMYVVNHLVAYCLQQRWGERRPRVAIPGENYRQISAHATPEEKTSSLKGTAKKRAE